MSWLLLSVGVLLLLAAIIDALWTALWVDEGAGPLTSWLTASIWWVTRHVLPRGSHRLLSLNGPVTLVLTLSMWVGMVWLGWTCIFAADFDSLINPTNGSRPNFWGRFYFVAYAIFTMGNGDFGPTSDAWQVATGLCTASGMLMISLVISYVISVVSAVVSKRSLASSISGLGNSAEQVVINMWNGKRFAAADNTLLSLSASLADVSEMHLAYPILHYYRAASPTKSTPTTMMILDDALTLLRFGVREDCRPAPVVLHSTRSAVKTYLEALKQVRVEPGHDLASEPTDPKLERLRRAGIPVVEAQEFEESLEKLSERRRMLERIMEQAKSERPPLPSGAEGD